MAPSVKRRSTRQAAARKRSIYVDPDTDDDFEAESEIKSSHPIDALEQQPRNPKKRKASTRSKPRTRSTAKRKSAGRPFGRPRKMRQPEAKHPIGVFDGPSDNRTPDWSSLPEAILREIFIFATQPFHERTVDARSNTLWLLRVARTCRAFAIPALEAFYYSPSFSTTSHLHQFLALLQRPNETRFLDYNVKVHHLRIDVRDVAYVAHNKPPFDLAILVAQLPQLQSMELLHPTHLPPYRTVQLQRWSFSPSELFTALAHRKIRLRSWRWSRDTLPKMSPLDLYETITRAHQTSPFERLEHLTVSGFNVLDSAEPTANENGPPQSNEATMEIPGLASSITQLPCLRGVRFISCDVVMDKFLLRLPPTLQYLELSNCLEITSDILRAFFESSGSTLTSLILNHNPSLSLGFLTSLRPLCPRLEILKVDLQFYSEKFVVSDATAFYDELLTEGEIPSWPQSIRCIEITHAQRWTADAAQSLFRSLVDSSAELQNLRHLVLHAHMSIPWRDRVGFRDQWIQRLRHVYLRKTKEPSKNLGSLRQFRIWKQSLAGAASPARILVPPHKHSGDTDFYSGSDAPPPRPASRPQRRSIRVADHVRNSRTSKSSTSVTSSMDDEDSSSEGDTRAEQNYPGDVVQGLCTHVDIRIDNQRPREEQWTEGDFLDSEQSGDEDWHEDADSAEEHGPYAW